MTIKKDRIEKALDTLAELCDLKEADERDISYHRRLAAEEILRHYREKELLENIKDISVNLTVNGAIPVRPMTREEIKS